MKAKTMGTWLITISAMATLLLGGCSQRPAKQPLTSSAAIVIEPGVSIGPVRQGMTMEQVVAELGEPEGEGEVLKYENLGFHVLPVKDNLVGGVICLETSPSTPTVKSFAGRTREGIGIGSTRAEVTKAYGEPTSIETVKGREGAELLRYKSQGLDFKIGNDKVYQIAVFFKAAS